VLQEAYDKGRSIFSFKAPTSTKEDDCNELRHLYTKLADFVSTRIKKEVVAG
jgi:hypothetical protein